MIFKKVILSVKGLTGCHRDHPERPTHLNLTDINSPRSDDQGEETQTIVSVETPRHQKLCQSDQNVCNSVSSSLDGIISSGMKEVTTSLNELSNGISRNDINAISNDRKAVKENNENILKSVHMESGIMFLNHN